MPEKTTKKAMELSFILVSKLTSDGITRYIAREGLYKGEEMEVPTQSIFACLFRCSVDLQYINKLKNKSNDSGGITI